MIKVTDNIFIGDSKDESRCNLDAWEIGAVLNVAHDLPRTHPFNSELEYMQVGLMDGPGNALRNYSAAVLALATLVDRREHVLVCCHDGGSRAVAVVTIYLILKAGKVSNHPTFLNYWAPWDKMLDKLRRDARYPLPEPHRAHREAFDKLPLGVLEMLL